MIGVLVPAHNEELRLAACLTSVRAAAAHPALAGEAVRVAVALDRCSDTSGEIAARLADHVVALTASNVGAARAAACEVLLAAGVSWLASTDADSTVAADWLAAQPRGTHDLFCGIVTVEDWGDYSPDVIAAYTLTPPQDGHPHIHGANLGIRADAYRRAGGFRPALAHEDVSLVHRCEALGLRIARRVNPIVVTSARRDARVREGFGALLQAIERQVQGLGTDLRPMRSGSVTSPEAEAVR